MNVRETDFVNRRYNNKEKAVLQVTAPPEIYKNDSQIEGNLSIGDNWINAIPGTKIIDFSKKSLFVKLPASHYKWDPNNYPSDQNNRQFTKVMPAGDWYGFTEG